MEYKDTLLIENIYFCSSELIKNYFKLKNKEIKDNKTAERYYIIYKKLYSLKTKNDNEEEFKKKCISFLRAGIEIEFPYFFKNKIMINKNNSKENNKNYQKLISLNENKTKKGNPIEINKIEKDSRMIYDNEKEINKIERKSYIKEINNKDINKDNIHIKDIYKFEKNDFIQRRKNFNKFKEIDLIINDLINNNININIIKNIKEISKDNNSDKFRRIIDEYFKKINQLVININNNTEIKEYYSNQVVTIICSLFPFLTKNQKEELLKLNLEKEKMNYLKNNILLFNTKEINEIDKLCTDILFLNINEKEKKEKLKEIANNIFNFSPYQKINIYYIYKLILLYKIVFGDNDKFIKTKLIEFKLHFILSNYIIFDINSDEIVNIYKDLLFMKEFYSTIYFKKIQVQNLINVTDYKNIKYGDENFLINKNKYIDIDNLFEKIENEAYHKIMDQSGGILSHFYKITDSNIKEIIDYSSYFRKHDRNYFLDNIFSLINIKMKFIADNIHRYKNSLKKLEEEIYLNGKKYLTNNMSRYNKITQYCTKDKYKKIFNDFSNKLNSFIENKYKNKYLLFPFGSITQFLSDNNSDLDIYLFIKENSFIEKIKMLEHIFEKCHIIGEDVKKVISYRICLISLKYKGYNIDLSITGFCPYIHSLLFKQYSIIDPRFPLIAMALKKFIKILNFPKECYLNSFSWMNLLVSFFQDIIKPPLLPKLFSNKLNNIIIKETEFGKKSKNQQKTFFIFFENTHNEKIPIPDCLFKKEKIREIYKQFLKDNKEKYGSEKNNLSCSELFLKFLEFTAFYLKYDTIYVRSSIEKEGFFNMNDIKNIEINNNEDELYEYKMSYFHYFTKKYNKYFDYNSKKLVRDGLILIRDPVDSHYNPGQSFRLEKCLENFINNIRLSYSILIKYGSFEKLKEKFDKKNNNKIDLPLK